MEKEITLNPVYVLVVGLVVFFSSTFFCLIAWAGIFG